MEWTDGAKKATLDIFCPCNGEKLTTVAQAEVEDLDRAVDAAWAAFPAWRDTPALERARMLTEIADRIDARAAELTQINSLETGYPAPVDASLWRYFAGAAMALEGITSTPNDHNIYLTLREPLGVVGQISAWNGPAVFVNMKVPAALAAGNCVIYRPSSQNLIGPLWQAEIIADVLPPGVFTILVGPSNTVGQAMLEHPGIKKLSFTGSTEVGIKVGEIAAKRLIPATLELGGKSPNIFFNDCDQKIAIPAAALSFTIINGQVCVAGTRIFVQEGIYDEFVAKLVAAVESLKIGPVWEEGVAVSSVINESQLKKVLNYVKIAEEEGAKVLTGGKRATAGELANGYYVEPTLIETTNDSRVAQEEIFGPVACVIKFTDEAEAIALANDTEYGLAAGIWTTDLNTAMRMTRAVESGNIWVNTYLRIDPGSPFGGYKRSGLGSEQHFATTLDHYTQTKSVVINTSSTSIF